MNEQLCNAFRNADIDAINDILDTYPDLREGQRTTNNLFTCYIDSLLQPGNINEDLSDSDLYNDLIRRFKDQHVYINQPGPDGATPLDIICRRGHLNRHMYEDNDNEISVPMQYQAFKDLAFMFERSGNSEEFEYTDGHPLDILDDYERTAANAGNRLIREAITYFIRHRNFIYIDGRFYAGPSESSTESSIEPSTEPSDWEPNVSSESEPSIADLTSSEHRRRANIAQTIRERDAANAANAAAAYAQEQAEEQDEECKLCYEPLNNIDGPGPNANPKCSNNCNDVVIACKNGHEFHRGCILNWCSAGPIDVAGQMGSQYVAMREMNKVCPLCKADINCPDLVTQEPIEFVSEFSPSPISMTSYHTISSEGFGKTKGKSKKRKTRRKKINVRGTKRRKLKGRGKTKRKSTLRKRKIAWV